MAKKTESNKSEGKVTRISAADSAPQNKSKPSQAKKTTPKSKSPTSKVADQKKAAAVEEAPAKKRPFRAIAEYFKGAWYELSQVRWPSRGATWSLTLAVILFTAFFVGLIVLLDSLFGKLFDYVIN